MRGPWVLTSTVPVTAGSGTCGYSVSGCRTVVFTVFSTSYRLALVSAARSVMAAWIQTAPRAMPATVPPERQASRPAPTCRKETIRGGKRRPTCHPAANFSATAAR